MTIVAAGFDTEHPISSRRFEWLPDRDSPMTEVEEAQARFEELNLYRKALCTPTTAYVFSDSLLSRDVRPGRMPIAETAEKIFQIPIAISVPLFDRAGAPTGRYEERYRYSCGVAYAGSSQMCQLVVERFRREMQGLRYTWVSDGFASPGRYAICRSGAKEDIGSPRLDYTEYGDDINFAPTDLPPLDSELVVEAFVACFDAAMQDHFPKEDEIAGHPSALSIQIDFVLLAYCLRERVPTIHTFGWGINDETFPKSFQVARKRHQAGDLVTLGRDSWHADLVVGREHAIEQGGQAAQGVRERLTSLIDEHRSANYVGGRVRYGKLDLGGFVLHR